jgi:hypothetical protein
MGLVWIHGEKIFCFRHNKEAVAGTVKWTYKSPTGDQPTGEQTVTIVASTKEIIDKSLESMDKSVVDWSVGEVKEFTENELFEIKPSGLASEGKLPVNTVQVTDTWSSEAVAV